MIYIATVWTLSAQAEAVYGNEGIERHIIRMEAKSPSEFEWKIRDRYISNPDNEVWFGPISLSKVQE